MRIFHTIDSAGLYGAESVLLNLVGQQVRQGLEPTILSIAPPATLTRPLEVEAARRGYTCLPFRMRDGMNLRGAFRLADTLARQGATVVHSHGYKTDILLAVSGRKQLAPIVATVHGWTARRSLSRLGLYRYLDQRALRYLDAVVTVTTEMHDMPCMARLDRLRLHHIPNAVTPPPVVGLSENLVDDPLRAALTADRDSARIILGAVGRLSREKNFSILISALSRLGRERDRLRLVVLGDGPEAGELKLMVARLGLNGIVRFTGFVPEARRYFELLDVLVIPSLTEGMPMTLLEAMVAGLPVIASAVGQIPDVLAGTGRLVVPGDEGALIEALHEVIDTLPDARNRALAAASGVLGRYGVEEMANRYLGVYQRTLELRGRSR